MTDSTIARRLRAGSALPAIALAAISITGGAIVATPAAAQDYTTGSVSGRIVDAQNKPIVGATVTLRSQAQNQTRTFTTSRDGNFSAAGLVAGQYDVSVNANGYDSYADTISIVAAQQNSVTLPLDKVGSKEIVVTGSRVRQDFTKTTTGLNTAARTCSTTAERSHGKCRYRSRTANPRHSAATAESGRTSARPA